MKKHKEKKEKKKMSKSQSILIISIAIAFGLIALSAAIGNTPLLINMLFLSLLIIFVPFSVYKFIRLKRIRSYEREFPNFLRDLAENQRADLSLIQALHSAAKSDYGMLSKEIKKMSDQLSWNVPMDKVLRSFRERVADSKTIVRSLIIIDQANKSGGSVEATMESLSNNIESIKEAQQEKASLLNQQVMMMYAIFFIFLGITIALIKFLIPLLQAQTSSGSFGLQGFNPNPCSACVGTSNSACSGCYIFGSIATAFDIGSEGDAASYYKSLFLTMILIQGFFSGLIAGQIGSDSMAVGMKHSMIMLVSGFLIFIIVVKTGII